MSRVPFPLPDPCPTCGGVVTYKGSGRRPVFCSPACKAAGDSQTRPDRRAVAVVDDPSTEHVLQTGPVTGLLVPEPDPARRDAVAVSVRGRRRRYLDGPRFLPAVERELPECIVPPEAVEPDSATPDGYVMRKARSRKNDPAAAWLAEHHPEALSDFGRDY